MMEFSANVASLQPSATIAVSSRVKQLIAEGHDILDLCVGEPDFRTPDFISEAGIGAIRDGRTRYTPAPGIPQLRAAIASTLTRLSVRGAKTEAHGVVVTSGAKQALFNTCFALFGPGDRVLIPVPYWTTYPAIVELARAEPVFVPGDPQTGGKVTPADLDRAAAGGAAGLMLNSPSNPTGAVYSHDELEALARWAADRGVWLISDEIYRRINFDGPLAPGVLDLAEDLLEKVVVIDGASKAYSMTGWRIGFSYSSRELADKMSAIQSQTTSSATTPAQYAALAAYTASDEEDAEIQTMRREFGRRKDLLVTLFGERLPHVRFYEPRGAFYLWIHTAGLARKGEGSIPFCERLLSEVGVALVPGAAFGDDEYVRLSFAFSEETLTEAVRRLERLG